MRETVFRSEDVPAADRFDYWRELQRETHAPTEMSSPLAGDFAARQRTMRLGEVTVWPAASSPTVYRRTPKLIRSSDPEAYHLALLLRGSTRIAFDDHEATHGPLDLHSNDTSRPSTTWAGDGHDTIEAVGVEIPKSLLSIPREQADRVIGRPMTSRTGVGALVAGFLTQLTADPGAYHTADGQRLGTILADLVSALFAQVLDEDDRRLPPEAHRRTLLLRIRSFIRRNLHDPELRPATVAAAHHISTSHLHRIFADDGEDTVAAWIRGQRLECARRELADPALRAVPVHRIAAGWGFSHHAAFTRAFRTTYGVSPTGYRAAEATRCQGTGDPASRT